MYHVVIVEYSWIYGHECLPCHTHMPERSDTPLLKIIIALEFVLLSGSSV